MKKLIALLLCLVMALSLVACGSKQDDTQAPADDQQGAEETSLVDAAKAEGADYVIAVGHCGDDLQAFPGTVRHQGQLPASVHR